MEYHAAYGYQSMNIQHAIISIVIQLAIYLLTGNILAASIAGPFLFFGREHWTETLRMKKAAGKTGVLTWDVTISALKIWEWDRKSALDFAITIPAVIPGYLFLSM
jgi:hypothetical protein